VSLFQGPLESPVSGGSPARDPPTQRHTNRDEDTTVLFLNPNTGETHVANETSNEQLARCARFGHIEKTKFGALSELAEVTTVS
jgi:hypothetical protein